MEERCSSCGKKCILFKVLVGLSTPDFFCAVCAIEQGFLKIPDISSGHGFMFADGNGCNYSEFCYLCKDGKTRKINGSHDWGSFNNWGSKPTKLV